MKHCTACKHFEYKQAYNGWYPGDSESNAFLCHYQVWEIDNQEDTQETLWEKLRRAETCGQFQFADYAK